MKTTTCLAIIVAISLLVPRVSSAQPPPEGWFWTLDGLYAAQGDADVGDDGGEFSLQRAYLAASLDYLWNPRTALGVSVGGGLSRYDFSGNSGLPGEPWEDIEDWRVSLVSRFAINDRVSGLIIPSYRVNRESGASTSGADTWGLLAGVSWRLRPGLTLGPGIGVFERLEESTAVFPILVIDWDITERWNLSTGRGLAASQGPGLTLGYALNDDWTLNLVGRYPIYTFALPFSLLPLPPPPFALLPHPAHPSTLQPSPTLSLSTCFLLSVFILCVNVRGKSFSLYFVTFSSLICLIMCFFWPY